MKLEIIGYDIANSDFYEMETQAMDNEMTIKDESELYIEKRIMNIYSK